MKKNEVPQDNEGLHEGKLRDLCYAVDENGKYVTVHSTGWAPKNAAMKQAWEIINENTELIRNEVLNGKKSPIAFFMEKNIMNPKLLSQYTGISVWKVKRHLKPKHFSRLSDETIANYADVFNVEIAELKNFR